jgi:lipopolysaccharide biosynthesis glycosyltransferase
MKRKKSDVYVGCDSSQQEAFEVCKHTLSNANVFPLYPIETTDSLASTTFTLSRFLVPYYSNYQGWSLYCDSDFLWLCDVNEVMALADDNYDVMVVKHPEYTPKTEYKMDGKKQYSFPRKNWSSLMLFNNQKCKQLTPELINRVEPKYLHRFMWTDDMKIGSIPLEYNWLVGYYKETETFKPKALHYTDGGPWHQGYENCEYSDLWLEVRKSI